MSARRLFGFFPHDITLFGDEAGGGASRLGLRLGRGRGRGAEFRGHSGTRKRSFQAVVGLLSISHHIKTLAAEAMSVVLLCQPSPE